MLNERLQILVNADQRRRLEEEARRRGTSVGSLIREAVDERFGSVTPADRREALSGIRDLRGRFLDPEGLNRIAGQERDSELDVTLSSRGS